MLVQIAAAGVCHSDLSVVNGNRARPVPMLLGHEASGRILALGSGVPNLRVGQQVVMTFLPRCGQCSGCATGGRMPCVPGSASNAAGELSLEELREGLATASPVEAGRCFLNCSTAQRLPLCVS